MNNRRTARRYARALADACEQEGTLKEAQEQLVILSDMLSPNRGEICVPELMALLFGPRTPKVEKERIADMLSDKLGFCEAVRNLLKVLIRNNRIRVIELLEPIFHALANRRRNVAAAVVESARPLAEIEIAQVRESLEKKLGRPVELVVRISAHLPEGTRILVNGVMIDGSVAGALERLERRIAGMS